MGMRPRSPDSNGVQGVWAVAFAATVVHVSALSNSFVYDDWHQVVANPWLRTFGSLPAMFTSNVWGFDDLGSNYYRPLMHVTNLVTYQLAGESAWAFHLVNLAAHAAASVLVLLLARRVVAPGLAWCGAVLYAVHPIHVEAVAWISASPDLLCTTAFLGALHLRTCPEDERTRWTAPAEATLYAVALLFKEPAVAYPLVVIVHDAVRRAPVRLVARRLLPVAFVTIGYLCLRWVALGGLAPHTRQSDLGAVEILLTAGWLLARYLGAVVWPSGLNAYQLVEPVRSALDPRWAVAVAVAASLAACGWGLRRNRGAVLGGALFVVPLLPSLYVPALGVNAFAERYLYLPSAGLVLVVAAVLNELPAATKKLLLVPLAAAVLVCAGASAERTRVWRDDVSLWSDTVKKQPDALEPWILLGGAHLKRDQVAEAIAALQRAEILAPSSAGVHANLGHAYLAAGEASRAIRHFQREIALEPRRAGGYFNLAKACLHAGATDLAEQVARVGQEVEAGP